MTPTARECVLLLSLVGTMVVSLESVGAVKLPDCVPATVVTVDSEFPDGSSEHGAAIVVKVTDSGPVVVTARHVVVTPDGDAASSISLGWKGDGPHRMSASIENEHKGEDWAVLSGHEEFPFSWRDLCLMAPWDGVEIDDKVHFVGHPRSPISKPWSRGVGEVAKIVGDEVLFQGRGEKITKGYSGGALFDARWRLVGLIRRGPQEGSVGIAFSLGLLEKALAPMEFDLTAHPARLFVFRLGLGHALGFDRWVDPDIVDGELAFSLVLRYYTRNLWLLGGASLFYGKRTRTPVVNGYPGSGHTTDSPVAQVETRVLGLLSLRWQPGAWASWLEPRIGWLRQSDSLDGLQNRLALELRIGSSYRLLWLGDFSVRLFGTLGLTATLPALNATDYHFSLAGNPGPQQRDLNHPFFSGVAGLEILR